MEPYTLLKDLSISDGKSFIKVRVSREWEGKRSGSQHVTSKTYIITDEEGTQVQAGPLQFGLIAEFNKKLKLGSVSMISDYNVERAPETYRPVPGEYIVKFHRKTIVRTIEDVSDIPKLKFENRTFQEARAGLGDVVNLMDVVDKLTETTHIQTSSGGRQFID
ncbi:replication factor A protein 1-like [Apium graveolens]|uniref:replication factor A protein 1-like n=1 Tax=Apium graveolens TaxID=4045 RepID=UPI003D79333A